MNQENERQATVSSDQPLLNSNIYNNNKSASNQSSQLYSSTDEINKKKDQVAYQEIIQEKKQNSQDAQYVHHPIGIRPPVFKPNYIPTPQDLLNLQKSIEQRSQSTDLTAASRQPTLPTIIPEKSAQNYGTINIPPSQQHIFVPFYSLNKIQNSNSQILQKNPQLEIKNPFFQVLKKQ